MPKVIANPRENILAAARLMLTEDGYKAFSMREAARRSGMAVGTLYNYFPSKDSLIAGVMLEDWLCELGKMKEKCAAARDITEGLSALHDGIGTFSKKYRAVWESCAFGDGFRPEFIRRHRVLVRQLADCLEPLISGSKTELPQDASLFFAENILVCSGRSELSFDSLLGVARRLTEPRE